MKSPEILAAIIQLFRLIYKVKKEFIFLLECFITENFFQNFLHSIYARICFDYSIRSTRRILNLKIFNNSQISCVREC